MAQFDFTHDVSQQHDMNNPECMKRLTPLPKTGDRIPSISRLVALARQFSSSLYANLDEFRALKESLKREGVFDETRGKIELSSSDSASTLTERSALRASLLQLVSQVHLQPKDWHL